MLSILIPTYNYNAYPLAKEIHKQAEKLGIDFEILVYDDASNQDFDLENSLSELNGVIYKKFTKNLGRVPMLQQLVKNAQSEILLTFDVDVFPNDRFFLRKLLDELKKVDADLYYGGTGVPKNAPSKDKILRWKFGKERESPSLEYRKEHPYNTIVCQSIVVKKKIFEEFLDTLLKAKDYYGLDIYFSYLLRKSNKKIHHFNNPVTHLGFDTNKDFLDKSKKAVKTYFYLYDNALIDRQHIRLVAFAEKYSRFGLCKFLGLLRKISLRTIENNLLSKKPSLFLLDIYKLMYYCQLKSKK